MYLQMRTYKIGMGMCFDHTYNFCMMLACKIKIRLWIAGRTPSAEQVAAALVTGAAGVTALYAFGVMVLCVSFRAIQIHALVFLMEALLDFGRWPAQVFPPALRVFFTFVVPLLVMTSYPAEALLGRLAWSHVAMTAAISASLMALARLWWRASVRSYTSASS